MKMDRRKAIGLLLSGVGCLTAGCQSLPSSFKTPTLQAGCEWIEFPYRFNCLIEGQFKSGGNEDPSSPSGGK